MLTELSTTEDTEDTVEHLVLKIPVSSASTVVESFAAGYHSVSGTPPR